LIKSLSGSQGHSWVPVTWFCVVVFAGALCLVSAAAIIFVEPNAAGSGIPETSAFLNGTTSSFFFCLVFFCRNFIDVFEPFLCASFVVGVVPDVPIFHF
jgi:H+/Cl- antiporter ClcA